MNAINQRIEEVKKYSKKDFSEHKITTILDNETHKHYYICGNNGYCWFEIVIIPNNLIILGDLGNLVFYRPNTSMLEWAKGSVDSVSYFAEKVVAGDVKEDFCWDVAREWLEEERATLKAELIDAQEVEDEYEQDDISKRLNILAELEEYIECNDQDAFSRTVYEEYSDYDYEILDSFWNYTWSFLWCREALKFALENV